MGSAERNALEGTKSQQGYKQAQKAWWLFDTGADCHITNDPSDYIRCVDLPAQNGPSITTGGGVVRPTKIGDVAVTFDLDGAAKRILLTNVLYIASLPLKIFSGEIFLSKGGKIEDGGATLVGPDDRPITRLNIHASGLFMHEYGKPLPLKRRADGFDTMFPTMMSAQTLEDSVLSYPPWVDDIHGKKRP